MGFNSGFKGLNQNLDYMETCLYQKFNMKYSTCTLRFEVFMVGYIRGACPRQQVTMPTTVIRQCLIFMDPQHATVFMTSFGAQNFFFIWLQIWGKCVQLSFTLRLWSSRTQFWRKMFSLSTAQKNVRPYSVVGMCAISEEYVYNESTGKLTSLWTTY